MGSESSVSVLRELTGHASQFLAFASDPAWVRDVKRQLAAEALRLLRAAAPGSDHQLAWAQMLGWTATAPDQLDLLAGLLDGSEVIEGLAIDTELRWRLLRRLAAMGRAGDAQIDAELTRDHTNAGQRHAAACRASVPDAEHKAAAWQVADRGRRSRDRGDRRDRLRLQPDGTGGPASRLHGEIFLPAAGDLGTTRWPATGRAGEAAVPLLGGLARIARARRHVPRHA